MALTVPYSLAFVMKAPSIGRLSLSAHHRVPSPPKEFVSLFDKFDREYIDYHYKVSDLFSEKDDDLLAKLTVEMKELDALRLAHWSPLGALAKSMSPEERHSCRKYVENSASHELMQHAPLVARVIQRPK